MEQQANVSNSVYSGLAAIFRVLVFAAILLGVLMLVRVIYLFFGVLETAPGYDWVIAFTDTFAAPLDSFEPIKTPYEGIFDIAGTGALLAIMVVEFILSGIKNYLFRKGDRIIIQVPPPVGPSLGNEDHKQDEEPALKK